MPMYGFNIISMIMELLVVCQRRLDLPNRNKLMYLRNKHLLSPWVSDQMGIVIVKVHFSFRLWLLNH